MVYWKPINTNLEETIDMEKQWSEMTKEEKRDERMKNYLNPTDIKFRDAKAENSIKSGSPA